MIMGKMKMEAFQNYPNVMVLPDFSDLVNDGYLPEAIINYIALLGWCPKDNQEVLHYKGWLNIFLLTESVNHNLFLIMIS